MSKFEVLHLIYLVYVLGILPWAAFRSIKQLRPAPAADGTPRPAPSRERILVLTLVSLLALLGASWVVADLTGIPIFTRPELGAREVIAAVVVFAAHFGLRQIAVALHKRGEAKKKSLLATWMPRTPRQWVLYALVAIFAGIAEEAAYRGVAWSLLDWYTGSAWIATLLCAVSFALAHITQWWKSVAVIFAIALMMHAFVAFAHGLVLAMVVHASYDIAVGVVITRRLAREAAQS